VFRRNRFTGFTYGIRSYLEPILQDPDLEPQLLIDGNRFEDNEVGIRWHYCFVDVTDTSVIVNNVFIGNEHGIDAYGWAGMHVETLIRDDARIVNNTFVGQVENGDTIAGLMDGAPTILNNLFVGNGGVGFESPFGWRSDRSPSMTTVSVSHRRARAADVARAGQRRPGGRPSPPQHRRRPRAARPATRDPERNPTAHTGARGPERSPRALPAARWQR